MITHPTNVTQKSVMVHSESSANTEGGQFLPSARSIEAAKYSPSFHTSHIPPPLSNIPSTTPATAPPSEALCAESNGFRFERPPL